MKKINSALLIFVLAQLTTPLKSDYLVDLLAQRVPKAAGILGATFLVCNTADQIYEKIFNGQAKAKRDLAQAEIDFETQRKINVLPISRLVSGNDGTTYSPQGADHELRIRQDHEKQMAQTRALVNKYDTVRTVRLIAVNVASLILAGRYVYKNV